jgi:hypothetical protein
LDDNGKPLRLIRAHIPFVKRFLKKTVEIKDGEMQKFDALLSYVYNKFGFTDDVSTYYVETPVEGDLMGTTRKTRRRAPELYDLYKAAKSNAVLDVVGDTTEIADRLRPWTREGNDDLFDGQTTIDFKNEKRIIIGLKHLDDEYKDIGALVIFDKMWKHGLALDGYKLIYCEETHYLVRDEELGRYVYDFAKRFRKFGGGLLLVTQNITDYMKTKYGPEIIKNASTSILMKQDKADAEILGEMFQMKKSVSLKMTKFNKNKGECYMIVDNNVIPMNVKVSDYELKVFKTGDMGAETKGEMVA